MKTCWRRLEDFISVKIVHLPRLLEGVLKTYSRLLEDEKLSHFIVTKIDNRFVISLDFGYVLHHCNAKGSLYIRRMFLNVVRLLEFRKSTLIGVSMEL